MLYGEVVEVDWAVVIEVEEEGRALLPFVGESTLGVRGIYTRFGKVSLALRRIRDEDTYANKSFFRRSFSPEYFLSASRESDCIVLHKVLEVVSIVYTFCYRFQARSFF